MTPEAQKLFHLLRDGIPHREVYVGRSNDWWVTYGGGQTTAAAVQELVRLGLVVSKYSNCPTEAYHVGKTLDCDATIAERKKHSRGKDAPLIYTDGSRDLR